MPLFFFFFNPRLSSSCSPFVMPSEDDRSASINAGWQRRVLAKVGGSAAAGFAAGALLSLLSRGRAASAAATTAAAAAARSSSSSSLPRAAPWALRTAGSCAVCAAAYALPLEGVRAVRKQHSPLNSAVAGGFAVGVLSSVHRGGGGGGGGSRGGGAVPLLFAASLGAAVAASLHAMGDWATGGRGLARPALEGLGLLDPPRRLVREREAKAAAAAKEAERRQRELSLQEASASSSSPSPAYMAGVPLHPWLEWLPVRKLTPEEVALRKRLKEQEFRENARLAAEGGMPAAAVVGEKENGT